MQPKQRLTLQLIQAATYDRHVADEELYNLLELLSREGNIMAADKYATVIRQLEVKKARQQLALEATEQHIEAIKALKAADENAEQAKQSKK